MRKLVYFVGILSLVVSAVFAKNKLDVNQVVVKEGIYRCAYLDYVDKNWNPIEKLKCPLVDVLIIRKDKKKIQLNYDTLVLTDIYKKKPSYLFASRKRCGAFFTKYPR